jgi:hypothetical protein
MGENRMSRYHVWVNCVSFERIVVEADSKAEAETKAIQHFNCNSTEGEPDHGETRIATEDDIALSEDYS